MNGILSYCVENENHICFCKLQLKTPMRKNFKNGNVLQMYSEELFCRTLLKL
jgi:hypothetical protein